MKLKKLSATFRDPEHGEKARPLGPEVKKRDVTAARDDYSSYLLSNQKANQQQDDDDVVPPPIPDPPVQEAPQLPESYRQAIDAFENAIALQGGNMDTSGDGTLDVLDVAGIIDFFMTVVGQGVLEGGSNPLGGLQGLFWNQSGYQNSFENGYGLFYNQGISYSGADGSDGPVYYTPTEDGIAESLLTWADYMAAQDDAAANVDGFIPIPIDWTNSLETTLYSSALDAVFDAYQGEVPADFFDTLLMNPQPTEADLEDLGAWFDANMLPIMNIYADVFMSNAAGDPLGYSDSNFQDMMNFIDSQGAGLGFFDVSVNDADYNPFSGNIFDVNNDGTFNGADIAAWADFTEMVSAVSGAGTISETNNLFSQADIDQIIAYYTYYGVEMAGGNMYFSTNGEWDDTQNLFNINNVAENPPLIFNLLDSGDVDAYVEEQEQDEIFELIQLNWADQRPVWGEAYGLSDDLQSEVPTWYMALANAIQPWIDGGFDANYAQLATASWPQWASPGLVTVQQQAFNQQIASWVSANLFDPDGDGSYDPALLDQSVVDYLISNHPAVNTVADITPELFDVFDFEEQAVVVGQAANNLQFLGSFLLNQCSDWVNGVGGIPDFANILGQESTETYDYMAQGGAMMLLAQVLGHQSQSNNGFSAGFGTSSTSLQYSFDSVFQYLGFDAVDSAALEGYMLDPNNGFLADNQSFANWLYAGFQGFVGYTDPNTGADVYYPVGEGVIWAPAGWEPGDNYEDYAFYQSGGPYGFDVQFYNFNLDLTSNDFLYSYNAFNDSTPFYIPPPPPSFVQNPSENVMQLYGVAPNEGAAVNGTYIDLPNFLERTGGMIDFNGDGNVGLADFLHLYGWMITGADSAANGTSWGNYSVYFSSFVGIGWSAFYSTQTSFGSGGQFNDEGIGPESLWYGGFVTQGDAFWSSFNPQAYSADNLEGFNAYAAGGSVYGSDNALYTGFDPAYALAHFLVFQYANDYVESGGQTPAWYTFLMGIETTGADAVAANSTSAFFDLVDPDWASSWGDLNSQSFQGDNALWTTISNILQQILPDELAMNEYSDFYLQNNINPNEFFVSAGNYTGEASLVPIVTGLGSLTSGSLLDALEAASSTSYIDSLVNTNALAVQELDFNGDGVINEGEINLYAQLSIMIQEQILAINGAGGSIDMQVLFLELMNNMGSYNLINQFVSSAISNGEATSEENALFLLFQPFVMLGILSADVDAFNNQYIVSLVNPISDSAVSTLGQWQMIVGDVQGTGDTGIIGALAGSLIQGAFYLGPNGEYIAVNELYSGLQAQTLYQGLQNYSINGTLPQDALAQFQVFFYPQLLEFIELYDDPDLNNDGFFTADDISFYIDLIESGAYSPGSPEFDALDLDGNGQLTGSSDVSQFQAFFGGFGGAGNPQSGQYGYLLDGVWVDFDYDDLDPEDYFGEGWSPQGYTETGGAPPPPTP